mgnify:CR=1 FL=1
MPAFKIHHVAETVSKSLEFNNLRIRSQGFSLSITYIGQLFFHHRRTESKPLTDVKCSFQNLEFILRIGRNKQQGVMQTLSLENRIRCKMLIESQEIFFVSFPMCKFLPIYGFQEPGIFLARSK